MTKEQLLGQIEFLQRTMPPRKDISNDTPETLAWLGRFSAAIEAWSLPHTFPIDRLILDVHSGIVRQTERGANGIAILLHQAQNALRMETRVPVNIAVDAGMVFDYFDSIRKIIEGARQDLLFVDRYLDAEFVSRYLPHVAAGVRVRLLARDLVKTLLPAVDAFAAQHKMRIEVRSAPGFHDRYVFVDGTSCFQSGASFKDGARGAATILVQVTDIFSAALKTYEDLWEQAKLER